MSVVERIATVLSSGADRVLGGQTSFAAGFQVPSPSGLGPIGDDSFGHDGLGGCLGAYHRQSQTSVGFTTDHIPPGGGCDPAAVALTAQLLRCLEPSGPR